uniref:Uncharacterized protein n=1 Tax=Arundo donax TaxID=35708 RepID=A0A0A9FC86_ARUDO
MFYYYLWYKMNVILATIAQVKVKLVLKYMMFYNVLENDLLVNRTR